MKEIVEVYTRVIIAFFGFVAPSFTILVSIFLEGIEKRRVKQVAEILQLEDLMRKANATASPGLLEEQIKINLDNFKKLKKTANKELNLLNPKRQVIRIFLPLTMAIVLVGVYHCERYYSFEWFFLKWITLITSVGTFTYAIYVLWQLFCVIIETKKNLIVDSRAVTLKQSPQHPNKNGKNSDETIVQDKSEQK